MSIRRRSSRACFVACLAVALGASSSARADDDALTPYRDRFRLGMDRYKAGAMAEAIRVWNGIYEEIGPKRGYRLSFDLARAYDTNGEATRAAERYRSFLDEVAARRSANESIAPLVEHEVGDADERLRVLNRDHGRIEIAARADATLTQIDDADPRLGAFTAYVAPGKHVVTFGPGRDNAAKVDVSVVAGELVVAKTPPGWVGLPSAAPPSVDPIATRRETRHPFSPVVLYAASVATAASVVAPILAYSYANSLISIYKDKKSQQPDSRANAFADYPGARTLAYVTLAIPITLGATTGVLTTWYFAGARQVTVTVGAAPVPGGALATFHGTF